MIHTTDKIIENICVRLPEYPCLLSIPGFGPDVSAIVIEATAILTGSRIHGRS